MTIILIIMELQLNGKNKGFAIVDKKDYKLLLQYAWHKTNKGYIMGYVDSKVIFMHRFIMNAPKNSAVDHINRIKHDNRKENLRITTSSKNSQNKDIQKNKKSSLFKGVFYSKIKKKFIVTTTINNKKIYLGRYKIELEAAEIYDMYIVHNNYEHIPLNFPDKKDEYLKRKYIPFVSKKKNNKYYGVSKQRYGYIANIVHKNKLIYLGYSKDQVICAKSYDKYIVDNNILNKKLNFPNDYPNYKPVLIIKTLYENIKENDNLLRLLITSKPNEYVLIDKEDYDRIKYFKWCICKSGDVSAKIKNKTTRLHRFLTNTTDPNIFIDHIDSNPLNNSKQNLRISNARKNSHNKKKRHNTSSKYLGISFEKRKNKWKSQIKIDGIVIQIGHDKKEINAAKRRDLFILENLTDEHFKLNFEWNEDDIKKWKSTSSHYDDQIKKFTRIILIALSNDNLRKVAVYNNILNTKIKNRKQIIGI